MHAPLLCSVFKCSLVSNNIIDHSIELRSKDDTVSV